MRKILFIKICSLIFNFCFLFSACSLFNVPVKEYLKEYTEEAKIVSHEISVGTVLDKNGMPCVSSNQDCVITYTLRNPQQYDLRYGIDYPLLTEDQKTAIGVLIPVADRAITKSGTSSFSLTYPIDFLTKCDCGEYDISPTITLTEPKSGRSFESYSFNLKSNSPPPVITSPVMYHTGTEGDDRYVLYFNLPGTTDMSTGLSRDLKTLAIGNKSFDISNTNGQISISDSDSKLTVLTTSASTTGTTVNPNITFTPSTNLQTAQSIRFETSQVVSDSETTFAITLTDEGGLTSTTVMSNKAVKIADPIFTINGTTLVAGSYTQNNDSYCTIRIAPPATSEGKTTSDATVDYNITRWNGVGTESDSSYTTYITGKGAGGANVNLSPGKYKISAYAYKSGFADSATKTVENVIVTAGKVYVDETDTGSKGYGTKAEPCTNVQDAVNLVFGACVPSTASTTPALISVLSNVTYVSGMTKGSNGFIDVIYNGSSDFYMAIDGSSASGGNATIDAKGSTASGGLGKRVMYVKKDSTGSLNLTLNSLTLTGGYTTTGNGGGIYVDAEACDITMSNVIIGQTVTGLVDGTQVTEAQVASSTSAANTAVYGGGLYIYTGTVTMKGNSAIAYNYNTSSTSGGSVWIYNGTFKLGSTSDHSPQIYANRAEGPGAAIYCSGGEVNIHGKIHHNYSATSGGIEAVAGAINMYSGSSICDNNKSAINLASGSTTQITMLGGTIKNNSSGSNYDVSVLSSECFYNIQGDTIIEKFYICGDAKLTITGSLTQSKVAIIIPKVYAENIAVITGTNLTQEVCNKFAVAKDEVNNKEYCVVLSGSDGVLKKTGVSVPDISTVSFTSSETTFSSSSNPIAVNTHKVSMSVTAKNSSNIAVDLTDCMTSRTMTLYQDGTEVATNTVSGSSGDCELYLPSLYLGTYQLKMSAVINGTSYSKQVNIEIVSE